MKTITLGFSPCPNDTFIFDALVHKRIDTGAYEFNPVLEDVEQLNNKAKSGELDITKISVGAYARVSEQYIILEAGSALGFGVGPLVVALDKRLDLESPDIKMAIPGIHTTANLLLSIFYPHITNKSAVLFSKIENLILENKFDAGLLIHEGRFTYKEKGLNCIADLGKIWEQQLKTPLPLGCICANRNLDFKTRNDVSQLITASIKYAMDHPEASFDYVKKNAVELDNDVIKQHIALYVNEFSLALGAEGRAAVQYLIQQGYSKGILPKSFEPIFN